MDQVAEFRSDNILGSTQASYILYFSQCIAYEYVALFSLA